MRILISLHLQITKSVPGMGRGRRGGIFLRRIDRGTYLRLKEEGRKLKIKDLKEEKEEKERAQTEIEPYSGGVRGDSGVEGLDKYTPLHWMTGILISHLPPGEIEGAEQGWSCHLNPSSPLILHHHPSLHLSACSSSTPAQGCHLNPASLIASVQPP